MMTSRPEQPTQATGAHRRAPRAAQNPVVTAHETLAQQPPLRYQPHLDGLFTYCLSVLCDHDAATAALGEVLALAERRADRTPAEELLRPWLYALARWECLRRLAEPAATPAAPAEFTDPRQHAELARLAWPEAAGTSAEQREALELAVRHGLAPHEVAAVMRLEPDTARALLSSAACEVERTRTALAVVESGRCPVVARFVGDTPEHADSAILLGATLRRELVRHVDDCADCRRTAERTTAGESWPGTSASTAVLPVIAAPEAAAHAAMLGALTPRAPRRRTTARQAPRYDRSGFPLPPKDRAAGRGRLRSRAVTTTVVATVVAAPVLALWAAYRGTPLGEGEETASVSTGDTTGNTRRGTARAPFEEPTGRAAAAPGSQPAMGRRLSGVSGASGLTGGTGPDISRLTEPDAGRPPAPGNDLPNPGPPGPWPGPGRLTVEAQPSGPDTLITLTASGGEEVHWSATPDAPWLRPSRSGGVLRPGETVTITVSVIPGREPVGAWTARVTVGPGGSVVPVEGHGKAPEPIPPRTPPPATTTAPTPTPAKAR